MTITQGRFTHVRKLDVRLRARVDERVAVLRVKLGRSDDFGQFFHVHRLNVDNVCS
jgi:hypothetical protein